MGAGNLKTRTNDRSLGQGSGVVVGWGVEVRGSWPHSVEITILKGIGPYKAVINYSTWRACYPKEFTNPDTELIKWSFW